MFKDQTIRLLEMGIIFLEMEYTCSELQPILNLVDYILGTIDLIALSFIIK